MKIGVAGMGLMGSAIARRLIGTGQNVMVYNRTRPKVVSFSGKAEIAESPAELASRCDLVISCVTDFDAVKSILLGREGISGSNRDGLIVADASTISPSQSEFLATTLLKSGITMLSVPVMGGPAAAEAGELVPIISGPSDAFEKVRPELEILGKKIFYIGSRNGAANAIKLALNVNIALIASAVAEGMTLVKKAGIDPALFIQVLNSTYFRTGLSEKKGPKMAAGNFDASFHLKNMLKDLELATGTAQENEITLPQTALAAQLFRAANNSGYSQMDYTSIYGFLAKINGVTLP